MKTLTAIVVSVKKFVKVKSILIRLKPSKKLDFKAGQFLMAYTNKKGRAFSIASPPNKDTIELLVKMHAKGKVSPYLYGLKKGDKLKISGPYGTFVVGDTNSNEIIFIAAGVGVAPFRSMICDSLERYPNKKITLIFGFREDFYFEEVFSGLEEKYKNFKLYASCSGNEKKPGCLSGRVTDHLERLIKSSKGKDVYICGPPAMIEATKKMLIRDLGFGEKQFHVETWG